jgi:membrane protein DedA with SNARE-associated domain
MSDFIIASIDATGYWGIFGLMLLENVFPPIPSELILPFVGFLVFDGVLNIYVAILVATLGAFLGALLWYMLGRFLSVERIRYFLTHYGVYVAISVEDFEWAERLFSRFQIPAVFLGRLLPTVRTVISVPAGSINMPIPTFVTFTILGTLVWNLILIGAGMWLRVEYEKVEAYIEPVTNLLIVLIVGIYVAQVVRFHLQRYQTKRRKS